MCARVTVRGGGGGHQLVRSGPPFSQPRCPVACPREEPAEPGAGLGPRTLTWQSWQHSPWAHTASGFRVHVLALQQRFTHPCRGEWALCDTAAGRRGQLLTEGGTHKGKEEPEGLALGLKTSLAESDFICDKARPLGSASERTG